MGLKSVVEAKAPARVYRRGDDVPGGVYTDIDGDYVAVSDNGYYVALGDLGATVVAVGHFDDEDFDYLGTFGPLTIAPAGTKITFTQV